MKLASETNGVDFEKGNNSMTNNNVKASSNGQAIVKRLEVNCDTGVQFKMLVQPQDTVLALKQDIRSRYAKQCLDGNEDLVQVSEIKDASHSDLCDDDKIWKLVKDEETINATILVSKKRKAESDQADHQSERDAEEQSTTERNKKKPKNKEV